LAAQFDHTDEAIESWNRAIALDPGQTLAHLYLAGALEGSGNAQDAAAHYKAFLAAIARQPASKRPPPEKTIAILIRMADCLAHSSQKAEAIQSYQLAAKIAGETNQAKLESVASVNEAALQAENGKSSEALQLYQRALQLDDSIGDQTSSVEDWLAYGRFLENSGFPERLAYACFVKSKSLQGFLPDDSQRKYLADLTQQAAKQIASVAGEIRRNPEPTLREALAFRP